MAHEEQTGGERKAVRPGEAPAPPVQHSGAVWHIRSLHAAQQVLKARSATTQAGFTAEAIPRGYFRHHPILVSDGPQHDEQRRKAARFFAPSVVERRHAGRIERQAEAFVARAAAAGRCRVDDLALEYSVEVTRHIVGIDRSALRGMSRRLVRFFRQPPMDVEKPGFGRTRAQWARAAVAALGPLLSFYLADVRPAVRHYRRAPADNVVSHLIAEGYSDADILVECVTFGTAGMVTTREFIAMACWHLLEDAALGARFARAPKEERFAILEEILRLEPVVGHLYRRIVEPIEVADGGSRHRLRPGDLVDVCVRQANADPESVGANGLSLCPGRETRAGVDPAGLSFSDGPHRCPGSWLAVTETDAVLRRLLSRSPRLLSAPTLGWDNLVSGYTLRGLQIAFDPARA